MAAPGIDQAIGGTALAPPSRRLPPLLPPAPLAARPPAAPRSQQVKLFKEHRREVTDLSFDDGAEFLASGAADGSLAVRSLSLAFQSHSWAAAAAVHGIQLPPPSCCCRPRPCLIPPLQVYGLYTEEVQRFKAAHPITVSPRRSLLCRRALLPAAMCTASRLAVVRSRVPALPGSPPAGCTTRTHAMCAGGGAGPALLVPQDAGGCVRYRRRRPHPGVPGTLSWGWGWGRWTLPGQGCGAQQARGCRCCV